MAMVYDGATIFVRQCIVCGLTINQDKRRPVAVARRVASFQAQQAIKADLAATPTPAPHVDAKTGGGLL
jgi:hypothetical protein